MFEVLDLVEVVGPDLVQVVVEQEVSEQVAQVMEEPLVEEPEVPEQVAQVEEQPLVQEVVQQLLMKPLEPDESKELLVKSS